MILMLPILLCARLSTHGSRLYFAHADAESFSGCFETVEQIEHAAKGGVRVEAVAPNIYSKFHLGSNSGPRTKLDLALLYRGKWLFVDTFGNASYNGAAGYFDFNSLQKDIESDQSKSWLGLFSQANVRLKNETKLTVVLKDSVDLPIVQSKSGAIELGQTWLTPCALYVGAQYVGYFASPGGKFHPVVRGQWIVESLASRGPTLSSVKKSRLGSSAFPYEVDWAISVCNFRQGRGSESNHSFSGK